MRKTLLVSTLMLTLAACQPSEAPQTAAPAPTPAPVAEPAPAPAPTPAEAFAAKLDNAIAGAHRNDANKARDQFRHPKETLTFFGLTPGQTVIEITPGGGWYTEILAPTMMGEGTFIGAIIDPASVASEGAKAYYTNRYWREPATTNATPYWEVNFGFENIGFKAFRIFRVQVASGFFGGQYNGTGVVIGVGM